MAQYDKENSSVGLTQARPISVLVSVYNRQLCKLIVGSRDRPLIAVWKTYRGGITLLDTVAQRSMSVIQAIKLPPVSQPSCSTWFCFKFQY